MLEKFVTKTSFTSQEDFIQNFHLIVPEHFNFAYDVMDEWAATDPDKLALLWTNDQGAEIRFTFGQLKEYTDKTAAYFQQLGVKKGDRVMLMLKRRYEFWFSILALHKLAAIVIPATHLLTAHDIVYRCNSAEIKLIVIAGEDVMVQHVIEAMPECPSVEALSCVRPVHHEGSWDVFKCDVQAANGKILHFHNFDEGIQHAPAFVRPERNETSDIMIMYFTSGTTAEPKMVAHDFSYALGHLSTGVFWHNLHENSLHLTIADTGWGKAVWGKLYGQWFAGATVFVYDHEKFMPDDILRMKKEVAAVHVSDGVLNYIQEIIDLTRTEPKLTLGASPRALLSLVRASQAYAYLDGRDFVKPDDVKAVAVYVLHHRVVLTPEARLTKEDADSILTALIRKARIPKE